MTIHDRQVAFNKPFSDDDRTLPSPLLGHNSATAATPAAVLLCAQLPIMQLSSRALPSLEAHHSLLLHALQSVSICTVSPVGLIDSRMLLK